MMRIDKTTGQPYIDLNDILELGEFVIGCTARIIVWVTCGLFIVASCLGGCN